MKKGLETVKYGVFGVAMAPFGLGSGPTESKWVWDSFGPVFSPYGPTGGQNRPISMFSGQFAVSPCVPPYWLPITPFGGSYWCAELVLSTVFPLALWIPIGPVDYPSLCSEHVLIRVLFRSTAGVAKFCRC